MGCFKNVWAFVQKCCRSKTYYFSASLDYSDSFESNFDLEDESLFNLMGLGNFFVIKILDIVPEEVGEDVGQEVGEDVGQEVEEETHIILVLAVFGSLTHGSYSCYSENIRRFTKETCFRVRDHIYKRNTDFLDYGYKMKFVKATEDHDSYVKLTHRDIRGSYLKVQNPHAGLIFSNSKNEVNSYDESVNVVTKDMEMKNQYAIRMKRDNDILNIQYCCQRPNSPPCETYSCH
ncbi:unnamed protein product [Diamesa hyperborea]